MCKSCGCTTKPSKVAKTKPRKKYVAQFFLLSGRFFYHIAPQLLIDLVPRAATNRQFPMVAQVLKQLW